MPGMAPVIRIDRGRCDAKRLDRIHVEENPLHQRPAVSTEQKLCTGPDTGQRLEGASAGNRSRDIDARQDRPVVIRGLANEGEHGAGPKRKYSPMAGDDPRADRFTKPDPVLGSALDPRQIDMGEVVPHCARLSHSHPLHDDDGRGCWLGLPQGRVARVPPPSSLPLLGSCRVCRPGCPHPAAALQS